MPEIQLSEAGFRFDKITLPDFSKQPQQIPPLFDLYSVAYAIGVAPKTLTYLLKVDKVVMAKGNKKVNKYNFVKNSLYQDVSVKIDIKEQQAKDGMYKEMRIPKKTPGEFRILHDPHPLLKYVQRQLLERILTKLPLPEYVTGFMKDVSITDTAKVHVDKEVVCCVDIANFFPSIKQRMIQDMFMSMGWPMNVSRIMSELCTYHNFVPQGAPTSPTISNLIGHHRFDKSVKALADQNGFIYTRYADDLVFSTDRTDTKHTGEVDYFLNKVEEVIRNSGFKVSTDKTKIMRHGSAQMVLGQSVRNETPTLPGKKYRLLKAIVFNSLHHGLESQAKRSKTDVNSFVRSIKGHLNFLRNVDPVKYGKLAPMFELAQVNAGMTLSNTKVMKKWINVQGGPAPVVEVETAKKKK